MRSFFNTFLVVLFYVTGFAALRRWWLRQRHGPLLRIVAFHDIRDDEEADAFRRIVQFFIAHYHLVNPNDVKEGNLSTKRTNILITFDDAYRSFYNVAAPVLEHHNLTAVLFAPSGFLDAKGEQEQQQFVRERLRLTRHYEPMTWQQLHDVSGRGFVIGGHTETHARLGKLSADDQRREIMRNHDRIREITGASPHWFAYPFGDKESFDDNTIRELRESGFERACTILPGFNHRDTDPYRLHRDSLSPSISHFLLRAWLAGGYDIVKRVI